MKYWLTFWSGKGSSGCFEALSNELMEIGIGAQIFDSEALTLRFTGGEVANWSWLNSSNWQSNDWSALCLTDWLREAGDFSNSHWEVISGTEKLTLRVQVERVFKNSSHSIQLFNTSSKQDMKTDETHGEGEDTRYSHNHRLLTNGDLTLFTL